MRKDIIRRSAVSLVSLSLIVYLLFLLFTGEVIVSGEYTQYNYLFYILIFAGIAFIGVVHGIYPFQIKRHKITLFVLGIFLILISQNTYLIDDPSKHIYIGDIISLFGVCVILFGATGLLHSKGNKEGGKGDQKGVEIIEV